MNNQKIYCFKGQKFVNGDRVIIKDPRRKIYKDGVKAMIVEAFGRSIHEKGSKRYMTVEIFLEKDNNWEQILKHYRDSDPITITKIV